MRNNISIFIITIIALLISCGPPKPVSERGDCYPTDLKVNVNSEKMDVSWKAECGKLISGYNIYISEKPMGDNVQPVEPHNTAAYAGDTDPEDGVEHYLAEQLEDGKKYYVSVRVLYPDRTMSKPSQEKSVVCGPRGEIELAIRYKGEHDGYSFDGNQYVDADKLENDFYFYSKDEKDFLCSPVKLDGFLKANKLINIKNQKNLEEAAKNIAKSSVPSEDRVKVNKGDWVWLKTTGKKSALIKILNISGAGGNRKIKLYFAYSPLSEEVIF